LVAGLAFAITAVLRDTGGAVTYSLDDAYIHMAIAKNLARHGVWGATPFHFASSSSSLIWTALLGLVYFLTGVHEITPLVVNVACALLTLWVADRYLVRWGAADGLRATALVGLVIAGPLPGMVLLGMEHILHILLTVWFAGAAIDALSKDQRAPAVTDPGWGTLCALGMLASTSRYEGLFLVAIVGLMFVIRGWWLRAVALGVVSALPTVAFGVVSMLNGWMYHE